MTTKAPGRGCQHLEYWSADEHGQVLPLLQPRQGQSRRRRRMGVRDKRDY